MFIANPRMALYRRKGMDLPSADFAGALASWRFIVGDYVPNSHEDFDLSDEWLARIAYAARAHHGSKEISDRVFMFHYRPQYRLKPLSKEGLELYWAARLVATKLSLCPPLNYLRYGS